MKAGATNNNNSPTPNNNTNNQTVTSAGNGEGRASNNNSSANAGPAPPNTTIGHYIIGNRTPLFKSQSFQARHLGKAHLDRLSKRLTFSQERRQESTTFLINCSFDLKVAVKILEKEKIKDKKDVERITREIKILKKVRHPNVIQLYEVSFLTECQMHEAVNGAVLFFIPYSLMVNQSGD